MCEENEGTYEVKGAYFLSEISKIITEASHSKGNNIFIPHEFK